MRTLIKHRGRALIVLAVGIVVAVISIVLPFSSGAASAGDASDTISALDSPSSANQVPGSELSPAILHAIGLASDATLVEVAAVDSDPVYLVKKPNDAFCIIRDMSAGQGAACNVRADMLTVGAVLISGTPASAVVIVPDEIERYKVFGDTHKVNKNTIVFHAHQDSQRADVPLELFGAESHYLLRIPVDSFPMERRPG